MLGHVHGDMWQGYWQTKHVIDLSLMGHIAGGSLQRVSSPNEEKERCFVG